MQYSVLAFFFECESYKHHEAMPHTYSQIHIQAVFAVKFRAALIDDAWKKDLFAYMRGTLERRGQHSLIVNGVADHVHLFFGQRPKVALSDLMRDVKANSSKWINERKLTNHRFEWQTGFGAFSYAHSQIDRVFNYVARQEERHRKQPFLEEYRILLQKFQVDFDDRYLFHEPL